MRDRRISQLKKEKKIDYLDEKIDPNRVNISLLHVKKEDKHADSTQTKKEVVNTGLFKEEIRRQLRQFHQGNHQYLKMCGTMVQSSFDDNKYLNIGEEVEKESNKVKGSKKNKHQEDLFSLIKVTENLHTQIDCSMVMEKIPIREIYSKTPYKRESILFETQQFVDPNNIFFLFEEESAGVTAMKTKIASLTDENRTTQFRGELLKIIESVSYYDILGFTYPSLVAKQPPPLKRYTANILNMAEMNPSFLAKLEEDEPEEYNQAEIIAPQPEIFQRIVECETSGLVQSGETLSFLSVDDYMEYKRYKAKVFKTYQIYDKEIVTSTNICNIISSQKIYLVEIIEEIELYIRLSKECEGMNIMAKVYRNLVGKADEYLRLICGYTKSDILVTSNIEDYPQKIYSFLERSIRMGKPYKQIPRDVLETFKVLQVWYHLPDVLFGYERKELHQKLYDLIEAILIFQEKMKQNQIYDQLKIRHTGRDYPQ